MKLLFVNFINKNVEDAGTCRISELYSSLEKKISVEKIYLDSTKNYYSKPKFIMVLLYFPESCKIVYKLIFNKKYKEYKYLWFWPVNYNYLWMIPILRIFGKKIIFDYNDDFYELSNNKNCLLKIKSLLLYKIPQIISPYISNYVFLTPHNYKQANNYIRNKSLSLTTGFDKSKFYPLKKKSDSKEIKIGYFGVIKSEFDIDFILNTIKKIKWQYKFYLYGTNKNILIPKDKRIKYGGILTRKEINKEMNKMDILLCPFKYNKLANNASPIKIFEYMACGKAILCANVESIKDVLKDNHNCLLYEPSNENDFLKKLNFLLQNSQLRRKLGDNALKDSNKYVWESITDKIIDFLDNPKK